MLCGSRARCSGVVWAVRELEALMPYRVKGSTVQVKRSGKWVTLTKHKTKERAEAHKRKLDASVGKGH